MHPRLVEIIDLLDRTRVSLLEAVEQSDPELREKGPSEGKWSVAEIIDHLAIVESGIAGLLTKLIERAGDDLAPETSDESVLASADRFNLGDRSIRIEAPDGVRPRSGVSLADARLALDDARRMLTEAIERVDGRAIGTLSFPHRIFGPLDGYQWLLFIAKHEDRHRVQIDSMARQESA